MVMVGTVSCSSQCSGMPLALSTFTVTRRSRTVIRPFTAPVRESSAIPTGPMAGGGVVLMLTSTAPRQRLPIAR